MVAFVGRDDELGRVHKSLQANDRVAISAIAGMGGIGKTELALQYAQRYWEDEAYPGGVCWLLCRGADVGTQLVGFAVGAMEMAIDTTQDLSRQVAACWRDWPEGEVLVVLDDVTDYGAVRPYLPPTESRFKVLVTTRLQLGAGVKTMPLEVLTPAAALMLLEELAGAERLTADPEGAAWLCEWLGYLPLGLELVGRYLAGKPDWSVAELRQRLEARSVAARALQKSQHWDDMTAPLGVVAAFELSWQELGEGNALAQTVLSVMGWFGLAPIRWEWVEQCLPDEDREALEDSRDDWLVRLHLVKRVDAGQYQLHQLVREYVQQQGDGENSDVEQRSVSAVLIGEADQLPQTPTQEQIQAFSDVVPHWQELIANGLQWVVDDDVSWPFVALGRFYEGQGAYGQAEPWREACIETVRELLSDRHPAVASSLNNLAELYHSQGRYEKAEPYYQQSLALRQELLGDRHPDVATSLNNLALLYKSQGRYEEAEPYYQQSLALMRELLGDRHPAVATSLNNLAGLYDSQGRYEEAEPYYQQSLALMRELLGDRHPAVATSLNNLALLYHSQGRYEEAEPYYQQALDISMQTLGKDHPTIGIRFSNLAGLYTNTGRFSDAEPLYLQSLSIFVQRLGQEHPYVNTTTQNMLWFVQRVMAAGQESVLSDHPLIQSMVEQVKQAED